MGTVIYPMQEQYREYLIDEAKYTGEAEGIAFPETEEEIRQLLKSIPTDAGITIQGGKTGITGASVPKGGYILNLSRMNKVKGSAAREDGTAFITVEPGITLMDLKKEVDSIFRKTPVFWPPDPTETSASIGGIASVNAQGICTLLYGDTKTYIESVKVMDPDGNKRETKEMDAFVGREGITGILTELTLKLIPKPESMWGISFFFDGDEGAGGFVDTMREGLPQAEGAGVAAVEYLDRRTIDLIQARKGTMARIRELPDVPDEARTMVYIEIHGAEEGIEQIAESLMEMAAEQGSDPDQAWAVSGEAEIEKMHAFRHAAAETANLFVEEARRKDDRITKLGSDMTAAGRGFAQCLEECRSALEEKSLDACIFGHALENHIHINILPACYEEYMDGIAVMRQWAEQIRHSGGKTVGEHGIGKLKKEILQGLLPEEYLAQCRALREQYDRGNRLNRGNII